MLGAVTGVEWPDSRYFALARCDRLSRGQSAGCGRTEDDVEFDSESCNAATVDSAQEDNINHGDAKDDAGDHAAAPVARGSTNSKDGAADDGNVAAACEGHAAAGR